MLDVLYVASTLNFSTRGGRGGINRFPLLVFIEYSVNNLKLASSLTPTNGEKPCKKRRIEFLSHN